MSQAKALWALHLCCMYTAGIEACLWKDQEKVHEAVLVVPTGKDMGLATRQGRVNYPAGMYLAGSICLRPESGHGSSTQLQTTTVTAMTTPVDVCLPIPVISSELSTLPHSQVFPVRAHQS